MNLLLPIVLGLAGAADLPADAPDLSVTHITGPRVDLSAPDKPVLIEVWATWCGACRATFPELVRLGAEHGDKLAVVALTDEDPMRVHRFVHARRPQMRFTVVTDPSSEASQALMFGGFGASGIPSSYLVHRGRIVWAGPLSELPKELPTAVDH